MGAISSSDITFDKPELTDFLSDYNTLLANLLVENFPAFKYLASATINRLEAQTHFYELLEKYIHIRKSLLANKTMRVIISESDQILFWPLHVEFASRVEWIGRKRRLLSTKLRFFLYSWPASMLQTAFFSFVGRLADRPTARYDYIIRTYFDSRCKGPDGRMREEYFGPFAEDLAQENRVLVIFRLISSDWQTFLDYLRLRRNALWDCCIWESLLTPWIVVVCYIRYLSSRIVLGRRIDYKGMDITALLQEALDEDYYQKRGMNVYLEYEVARKALDFRPLRIYLPYENQPWEKIYPYVRNERKSKSTIVGFQHTGVSYKLLNYFPCLVEKNLPVYPDSLLTVGDIFARLLRENASYPCKIKVGAALRHYRAQQDGRFMVKSLENRVLNRRLVYAFSYDLATYKKIVDVLVENFGNTRIEILLRFHPDYKEQSVLQMLDRTLPANFIPARKMTWEEIYRNVDFVLYDDNSIGLEAMLYGVLTLLLDLELVYNCDRMFYFDAWPTTVSSDNLAMLRDQLLSGSFDSPYDSKVIETYLQSYYHPYSKPAYAAFLE